MAREEGRRGYAEGTKGQPYPTTLGTVSDGTTCAATLVPTQEPKSAILAFFSDAQRARSDKVREEIRKDNGSNN